MLRRRSHKWWVYLGLMLAIGATAFVVSLRCLNNHLPYFGLYHDDAIYAVTGKSLADGTGYRIMSLPGTPVQTKYPILYPLLLSCLWRAQPNFPDNILLLTSSGLVLGFAFAAASVAYLLRTKRITLLMSAVIFGATVLNIKFQSFLPMTMSDFLYGLSTTLVLWLTEGSISRRTPVPSVLRSLSLGMAAVLPVLIRSVGTIVGPLVLAYLVIMRKYRQTVLAAVSLIICSLPIWWWQSAAGGPQPQWLSYYTSYGDWTAGSYRDVGAFAIIASKLYDIYFSVPRLVWPLIDVVPYQELSVLGFFLVYRVSFILLWLLLFAGLKRDIGNRRWCLLPLYAIGYGLSMIAWPGFTEWRQVLVFLPFIYYFYYCGFRELSRLLKRTMSPAHRSSWRMMCSGAAVLFAFYLVCGSALPSVTRAGYYPKLLPWRPDISADIEHKDVLDTYKWIQANTGTDDIFVCSNESLLWLYTGRRGVQPSAYESWRQHSLKLVTPQTVLAALRGSQAGYLLLDPSYGGAYQAYAQYGEAVKTLASSPYGLLTPAYRSPNGVMLVFSVRKAVRGLNR